MKVINYGISACIYMFLCSLIFNHVNSWAGVLLLFVGFYFAAFKIIKFYKVNEDEKNQFSSFNVLIRVSMPTS